MKRNGCMVCLVFLLLNSSVSNAVQVGQQAPSFFLKTLSGRDFFLTHYCGPAPLRGKTQAVVLSFFATWCVPCKAEIPVLEKLQERYKDKGVRFFLVDVSTPKAKEAPGKVREFIETLHSTIPVLMDTYGSVYKSYGGTVLPTLFIIDKAGMIRFKHQGLPEQVATLQPTLSAELEEVLSQPIVVQDSMKASYEDTSAMAPATAAEIDTTKSIPGSSKDLRKVAEYDVRTTMLLLVPDGKTMVLADRSGKLSIHSVEDGGMRRTLVGHKDPICAAAISSDCTFLASADEGGVLKLWNVFGEREIDHTINRYMGTQGPIRALAFHPTRDMLAVGGKKCVCVWDVSEGRLLKKLNWTAWSYDHTILSVAFDSNGERLAVGSTNDGIRIWDMERFKELCHLRTSKEPVSSLRFLYGYPYLVSSSANGVLTLWDTVQKKSVVALKGHTSMIQAIDIRDDLLISGDVKGGIVVWNLNKVLAVADTASHEAGARVRENAQWTAMASLGTGLGLRALSFTIGGNRIISLGYDLSRPNSDQGKIVLWEIP